MLIFCAYNAIISVLSFFSCKSLSMEEKDHEFAIILMYSFQFHVYDI
jgi:hypothetical protein